MGRNFLGAALLAVFSLGHAPAQASGEGRIRLEGRPASHRRVYGGFEGLKVQSILPRERELTRRMLAARPGGGAINLDTVQTLFEIPGEGPPSTEGNGVLLTWDDLGAGDVRVSVDGIFLGTVPESEKAVIVTGIEPNCDPGTDPGCTPNLPPACKPFDEFDDAKNVHQFTVEGTSGTQTQCQQVLPNVPVFQNSSCCLRLDLNDSKCDQYLEDHFCNNRLAVEGTCDIIVGGSNDGPTGTLLEVFVDGKSAVTLTETDGSDRICFERSAAAGTRGTHEIVFGRGVNREDAAVVFWLDPDGSGFINGLVGAFSGEFACPETISTTCGKPKAPSGLLVRQVTYGAGSTNALRASWQNGEDPYEVGIDVFFDGVKVGSRLPGDANEKVLSSLASGNHQVEVQGDSGVPEGPSDKTGLPAALKSTAPFPAVVFGNLTCQFSAAGGGKTTASWQVPAGLSAIDVLVQFDSVGEFILVGTLAGNSPGMTLNGTTAADAIRLQPLKVQDGNLYGLAPIDLPCGGGSPAGQFPGDMNQDRAVDLSDAVSLLSFLFLGNPVTLPCGATTSAGNKALLDWNGDTLIDLSDPVFSLAFMFLGGPTHLTGPTSVCRPMAGCPALCSAP